MVLVVLPVRLGLQAVEVEVEVEQHLQHHLYLHQRYQFQQTSVEHLKGVLQYVILSVLNYNNWWMFCKLPIHGEYLKL